MRSCKQAAEYGSKKGKHKLSNTDTIPTGTMMPARNNTGILETKEPKGTCGLSTKRIPTTKTIVRGTIGRRGALKYSLFICSLSGRSVTNNLQYFPSTDNMRK